MLKFCSLYSGSTGNSSYVESSAAKILIDAGVSAKKIVTALESININITDIDAIIVTHEHSDHTQGLGTLSKKYSIPVYANIETWNAMPNQKEKISACNQKSFNITKPFFINDLLVEPFSIPHDAANPCGFNIYNENKKISIATDLGHISKEVINSLENSSFLLLESNYDPNILKYSSYPYTLKSRISGPTGHLSNNLAGKTISHLIQFGLKNVMLGHLSKENNFPELAYKTVLEELSLNNYDEASISLIVANRTSPSKIIEIC